MGCSSSAQKDVVTKDTKGGLARVQDAKSKINSKSELRGDSDVIMENKEEFERSDPDGATSTEQGGSGNEAELEEEEDKVEMSLKPIVTQQKNHATQATLNFVYKNSLASSPAHTGGNFGGLATGGYGSPAPSRYVGDKRRPSGVPPPTREFRPGDFIFQKNLNSRNRSGSMAEADEDEENEEY
ncbi:uncharacterized protein LOC143456088 [Clavelina lepadiformis]|uniref:Uncharacterized protein n=1 Tax=Clavelina lepadiformis TaxID=159417 RepID=A0ABP0FYA3_CLALP